MRLSCHSIAPRLLQSHCVLPAAFVITHSRRSCHTVTSPIHRLCHIASPLPLCSNHIVSPLQLMPHFVFAALLCHCVYVKAEINTTLLIFRVPLVSRPVPSLSQRSTAHHSPLSPRLARMKTLLLFTLFLLLLILPKMLLLVMLLL